MNDDLAATAWRRTLPPLVVMIAAVLWLYRDTAIGMVTIWARSETFAHAFLVPPISAWLIWRQRVELMRLAPRPSPWALPLFGVAALAWLLGDLVATNAVTQLALVTMLILAVPLALGWRVARQLAFPLGFLYFSVPIGEFLLPVLMEHTADFTVSALRLVGIPVYREGQQFVIPSGNWSVVEACSGVRYLIASLMVGVLYAYLNYRSTRRRLVFVGISIVVPIIANWLRAFLIVLVGHLSNNRIAVGVDHLIYGWVFFGIVMLLLYAIGARWAEPAGPPVAAQVPTISGPPRRHAVGWALAVATLPLLLAPPGIEQLADRATSPEAPPRLAFDDTLAPGWTSVATPVADWKPVFRHPDAETTRTYAGTAGPVGLYVAYYRHQSYGRKLVSSENVLAESRWSNWSVRSTGERAVTVDGTPLSVERADLRGSPHPGQPTEASLVAWQLYWVDGKLTASDAVAKWYGAKQRLARRGDAAAVLVMYARSDAGADADALLEAFLRANLHGITARLSGTRDGERSAVAEK